MKTKLAVAVTAIPILLGAVGCSSFSTTNEGQLEQKLCDLGVRASLYKVTGGEKEELLYNIELAQEHPNLKSLADAVSTSASDSKGANEKRESRKVIAEQCIVEQKLKG